LIKLALRITDDLALCGGTGTIVSLRQWRDKILAAHAAD
jgi:hypothetical protein